MVSDKLPLSDASLPTITISGVNFYRRRGPSTSHCYFRLQSLISYSYSYSNFSSFSNQGQLAALVQKILSPDSLKLDYLHLDGHLISENHLLSLTTTSTYYSCNSPSLCELFLFIFTFLHVTKPWMLLVWGCYWLTQLVVGRHTPISLRLRLGKLPCCDSR